MKIMLVLFVIFYFLNNPIFGQQGFFYKYHLIPNAYNDNMTYCSSKLQDIHQTYIKKFKYSVMNLNNENSDSLRIKKAHLDSIYSWRNSIYLAVGWGLPQGARFELGYNFGEILSFGISFGIGDNWSRDPAEGTFAILGSLRFPIESSPINPYLLICSGGTFSIFSGSDSYILVYLGSLVKLSSGIHLRPEIGLALTSKYISGGKNMFGGSSPLITEDISRLGVNLSLEFDFAHIF
ncbi:MAG: hypothetical protein N2319_10685 [Candidatus Kapabacteria bacterium]|nr:hypothetical protein [Candidatus Kapabacteria bacterium]